jgi:hypothetical protein
MGRPKKIVDKGGRPSKKNDERVKKLLEVYRLGVTDEIAASYAGISKPTLYAWCKDDPELLDQIAKAKDYGRVLSGQVVMKSIVGGDVGSAKWWLEKKYSKEFQSRPELVEDNRQVNVIISNEQLADRLLKLLKPSE